MERQRNTIKYNSLLSNNNQNITISDQKKNSLPKLRLSNNKLNLYKYQKSYYRFGKIEKLNLSSKTANHKY